MNSRRRICRPLKRTVDSLPQSELYGNRPTPKIAVIGAAAKTGAVISMERLQHAGCVRCWPIAEMAVTRVGGRLLR
jgi:hypothetical protein